MSLGVMKLFAEYLGRIGRVAVVVEGVQSVEVLSVVGDTLELRYVDASSPDQEWTSTQVRLPATVNLDSSRMTFTEQSSGKVRSFQLHLNAPKSSEPAGFNSADEECEKWSKSQLNRLRPFQLECNACKNVILSSEDFPRLSDMPSEHWRELMDYWHCHKPSVKGTPSEGALYSSTYNHSLRPTATEILIGKAYFLVLPESINKCTISGTNLKCKGCGSQLGEATSDNLYKLPKWRLVLRDERGACDTFSAMDDVLGSLVEYAREQSGRYLLVKCKGSTAQQLLWLFNIHLGVTLPDGRILTNAMKILVTADEQAVRTARTKHNVDEITVEEEPYDQCVRNLAERNGLLPSSLQIFGAWRVHYVKLFES